MTKHSELKEKHHMKDQQWIQIKRQYKSQVDSMLSEIKQLNLPSSIVDAIQELINHYSKYIDIMDVDQAKTFVMQEVLSTLNDRKSNKKLDIASDEILGSASPDDIYCPGE